MMPLRLLVIEDCEDDALLLLREVRRGGYEVSHERVDTPSALTDALDRQPWDLVVSDFSMPNFSGTEALSLLRGKGFEMPFIFVSGTLGEETAVAALRNGAQDYLVKGNLKRLVPAIQRELRDAQSRRERKELEQKIHQLQKFEAIGRLAGGIAHDFNNVLGAILGWVELACNDTQPDSKVQQRLEKIRDQAQRAVGLTGQLLAFARRQVLQRKRINLNVVVEEGIKLLRSSIGVNIDVSISVAPDLQTIIADPAQLDQVLMNLCLNARDAMPTGGRLNISTANTEVGEEMGLTAGLTPGSYVVLSVADTGTGMDAATIDRIFEPFFTTKEVGKGTGLGLATVYGIVQQHGGTILCTSELGHGTLFRVLLPGVRGAPDETGLEDRAEPRKGRETILLAEDHEGLRESTQCMLEGLGYRVLTAACGSDAVDVFRRNQEQVNVVILDAVLPTLSGPDVRFQILQMRPDAKIFYTSGHSSEAGIVADIRLSGVPLLRKPYSSVVLSRMIGNALEQAPLRG